MVRRNQDGTIAKGNTLNPLGCNGHKEGWQRYGTRAKHWLDKLTAQELRDLATDSLVFNKLSSLDAIIIRHLVNTLSGDDIRGERKELLDRIEGTPDRLVIQGDKDADPIQSNMTVTFVG